ncbi:MAG TPA: ATP-binding protein [Candidatus Dormibacteraeota bacterium]|nr:ATP-binding protein [Candidatus Dormibacteraeota bacterium]
MVERRFPRNLGSLEPMVRFVADYVRHKGFDAEHSFTVDLLVEEIFTNMLRHAKGGGPDVSVGLEGDVPELVLTLRDYDVDSFDPTAAPPAGAPGGEGVGLRLVRRISDSIRYEYRERSAIITLTKRFPL